MSARRCAAWRRRADCRPGRSRAPSARPRARPRPSARHCSSLNSGRPSSRESSSADSPRISRSTTSRLRAALQRWPGASGPRSLRRPGRLAALWPVDSVDGLRPPSLTTGPSTAVSSIDLVHAATSPCRSPRTNGCPRKPGAAQPMVATPLPPRGEARTWSRDTEAATPLPPIEGKSPAFWFQSKSRSAMPGSRCDIRPVDEKGSDHGRDDTRPGQGDVVLRLR